MMILLVVLNAVLLALAIRVWRQNVAVNKRLAITQKRLTDCLYALDREHKRNVVLHAENVALQQGSVS